MKWNGGLTYEKDQCYLSQQSVIGKEWLFFLSTIELFSEFKLRVCCFRFVVRSPQIKFCFRTLNISVQHVNHCWIRSWGIKKHFQLSSNNQDFYILNISSCVHTGCAYDPFCWRIDTLWINIMIYHRNKSDKLIFSCFFKRYEMCLDCKIKINVFTVIHEPAWVNLWSYHRAGLEQRFPTHSCMFHLSWVRGGSNGGCRKWRYKNKKVVMLLQLH